VKYHSEKKRYKKGRRQKKAREYLREQKKGAAMELYSPGRRPIRRAKVGHGKGERNSAQTSAGRKKRGLSYAKKNSIGEEKNICGEKEGFNP